MGIFIGILIILAYILGSIPTSIWVSKGFYGIDIREHGSGNAGATNTFRVLGVKAGVPVFVVDAFKGWAAVQLVNFSNYEPDSKYFITVKIILGICAVIGHIFPLFAQFKGGKGVATLLGMVISLHPFASFVSVGVFVVILLLTRYVSLSSMIAGITFPLALLMFKVTSLTLIIFGITAALLLIVTHQKNIDRLIKRQESKVDFRKKAGRIGRV